VLFAEFTFKGVQFVLFQLDEYKVLLVLLLDFPIDLGSFRMHRSHDFGGKFALGCSRYVQAMRSYFTVHDSHERNFVSRPEFAIVWVESAALRAVLSCQLSVTSAAPDLDLAATVSKYAVYDGKDIYQTLQCFP